MSPTTLFLLLALLLLLVALALGLLGFWYISFLLALTSVGSLFFSVLWRSGPS